MCVYMFVCLYFHLTAKQRSVKLCWNSKFSSSALSHLNLSTRTDGVRLQSPLVFFFKATTLKILESTRPLNSRWTSELQGELLTNRGMFTSLSFSFAGGISCFFRAANVFNIASALWTWCKKKIQTTLCQLRLRDSILSIAPPASSHSLNPVSWFMRSVVHMC